MTTHVLVKNPLGVWNIIGACTGSWVGKPALLNPELHICFEIRHLSNLQSYPAADRLFKLGAFPLAEGEGVRSTFLPYMKLRMCNLLGTWAMRQLAFGTWQVALDTWHLAMTLTCQWHVPFSAIPSPEITQNL